MIPEISEFSYGFALTNEIVGWAPVAAAPVFPSLIEEGQAGGGYDVRLDMPGVPLFLQFKRADCMVRSSAREIRDHNLQLSLPFYRFKITESTKSIQHQLLLELDDGVNAVFYVAPRFHELVEINAAWDANEVASRSIFVAPAQIGILDTGSHRIAYDNDSAFLCSEPRPVEFLTTFGLIQELSNRLSADNRPLREKIPEMVDGLERAQRVAEERAADQRRHGPSGRSFTDRYTIAPEHVPRAIEERSRRLIPSVPTRPALPLSGPKRELREVSDTAAKIFNAQLIIVQETT